MVRKKTEPATKTAAATEPVWTRRVETEPPGDIVVTWNEERTRILAVTRQNDEGQILSVIAEAPAEEQSAPEYTVIGAVGIEQTLPIITRTGDRIPGGARKTVFLFSDPPEGASVYIRKD
jgi:hypothetical protein